jgi:hypothetical protein
MSTRSMAEEEVAEHGCWLGFLTGFREEDQSACVQYDKLQNGFDDREKYQFVRCDLVRNLQIVNFLSRSCHA